MEFKTQGGVSDTVLETALKNITIPTSMGFDGVTPNTKNTTYDTIDIILNRDVGLLTINSITFDGGSTIDSFGLQGGMLRLTTFHTANVTSEWINILGEDVNGYSFTLRDRILLPNT